MSEVIPNLLELETPPEIACVYITGRMCFPRDEEKYVSWIVKAYLALAADFQPENCDAEGNANLGQGLGEALSKYGGWRALANATIGPGQKTGIARETRVQHDQGVVAGWLLKEAWIKKIGLDSARKCLTSDESIAEFKSRGFKPPAYDPKSLERIWRKFRPVAHYWAAYVMPPVSPTVDKKTWYLPLEKINGGLAGFLDLASEILVEASRPIAKTGPRDPVIPPREAWNFNWNPPHTTA